MPNKRDDIAESVKKVTDSYYGGRGEGDISTDHIMVYLLDKLKRGTDRLNCLTFVLIIFTLVLAVLTGILVRPVVFPPCLNLIAIATALTPRNLLRSYTNLFL